MYLNTTFGGVTAAEFNIAGLNRVAIIEKAKIASITGGGNPGTDVTAITVDSGSLFQEIFFSEDSANYTQELTASGSSKFITQTLTLRVDTDETEKAHQVILGRQYVALVKKNNGKWVILGQTNGLRVTAMTANSNEDDANHSYTLSGKNLGLASNVELTTGDADALINSIII